MAAQRWREARARWLACGQGRFNQTCAKYVGASLFAGNAVNQFASARDEAKAAGMDPNSALGIANTASAAIVRAAGPGKFSESAANQSMLTGLPLNQSTTEQIVGMITGTADTFGTFGTFIPEAPNVPAAGSTVGEAAVPRDPAISPNRPTKAPQPGAEVKPQMTEPGATSPPPKPSVAQGESEGTAAPRVESAPAAAPHVETPPPVTTESPVTRPAVDVEPPVAPKPELAPPPPAAQKPLTTGPPTPPRRQHQQLQPVGQRLEKSPTRTDGGESGLVKDTPRAKHQRLQQQQSQGPKPGASATPTLESTESSGVPESKVPGKDIRGRVIGESRQIGGSDEVAALRETEEVLIQQRPTLEKQWLTQRGVARSAGDKTDWHIKKGADPQTIEKLEAEFDIQQAKADALEKELRDLDRELVQIQGQISGTYTSEQVFAELEQELKQVPTGPGELKGTSVGGFESPKPLELPIGEPTIKTPAGGAIRESRGAKTRPGMFESASANEPKSVPTGPRADIAEASAYKAFLESGEIGLQRPAGANLEGGDFITAAEEPDVQTSLGRVADREIWVIVNDTKSSGSVGKATFPKPAGPEVPPEWMDEVHAAVQKGHLDLGDLTPGGIEDRIRAAVTQGRVRLRQVNVDYSPAGGGRITVPKMSDNP